MAIWPIRVDNPIREIDIEFGSLNCLCFISSFRLRFGTSSLFSFSKFLASTGRKRHADMNV
ncbi:hypothetical protein BpHYR1_026674 [Brachionus plicatilis]|uniref:Uncharacterized protein n=1 Tax=Brachionus plicatilis TaxID=10195 RepID=A0A3M7Q2H4_BRAPC|nr:hypothetical protein BpHYR1_026674 [Brachionus plicatilis]